MTWQSNRRFRRDIKQLVRQGHDISYSRDGRGRFWFYVNGGERLSPEDLSYAAKQWRRKISPEEMNTIRERAKKLAKELSERITFVTPP